MTRPPPRSTLFPTRRSSDLDSEGGQTGTLVELNSETDFVAKNDKFVALGDEAVAAAVESGAEEPADHAETRSEEHTSELQSRGHLVCRLLLEKNKKGSVEYE